MCPMTMLRFFRLSLFAQIVSKLPPHLVGLIDELADSPKTWACGLMADLRWLSHGSFWGELVNTSFDGFYTAVASDPSAFARRVKVYCRSLFANLASEVPTKASLKHLGCNVDCHICNRPFASMQQLNLHMFKAHQVRNPMRIYVATTYCIVCLKEFHTRERALNHVKQISCSEDRSFLKLSSPFSRRRRKLRTPPLLELARDAIMFASLLVNFVGQSCPLSRCWRFMGIIIHLA